MTVDTHSTQPTVPAIPANAEPRLRGRGFVRPTNRRVRFTLRQYLRMDRAGLFDDTRVELILGRIYPMHAQNNPHEFAISKGSRKLLQLFSPATHWVVIQGTLRLPRYGAPDPDFHVFDIPEGARKDRLPFLLIEVSDSTYRRDSGVKLQQYARSGIADYWIVNIRDRRVEVYRRLVLRSQKEGWRYADATHFLPGQSIPLLARPDVTIAVTDLLPEG